jgi:hypothetical protein
VCVCVLYLVLSRSVQDLEKACVHIESALGKKGTLPLRIETIKVFSRIFPDTKTTNARFNDVCLSGLRSEPNAGKVMSCSTPGSFNSHSCYCCLTSTNDHQHTMFGTGLLGRSLSIVQENGSKRIIYSWASSIFHHVYIPPSRNPRPRNFAGTVAQPLCGC